MFLASSLAFSCAKRNVTGISSEVRTATTETETPQDAEKSLDHKEIETPNVENICANEFNQLSARVGKTVYDANEARFMDRIKNSLAVKACGQLKEKFKVEYQCSISYIDDDIDSDDEAVENISSEENPPTPQQKWRKQSADVFFKLCENLSEGIKKSSEYFDLSDNDVSSSSDSEPAELVSDFKKGDLQFKVTHLANLKSLTNTELVIKNGTVYPLDAKELQDSEDVQCKVKSYSSNEIQANSNFKMISVQESVIDDNFSTLITFLGDSSKSILVFTCQNPAGNPLDLENLKKSFKNTLEFFLKK